MSLSAWDIKAQPLDAFWQSEVHLSACCEWWRRFLPLRLHDTTWACITVLHPDCMAPLGILSKRDGFYLQNPKKCSKWAGFFSPHIINMSLDMCTTGQLNQVFYLPECLSVGSFMYACNVAVLFWNYDVCPWGLAETWEPYRSKIYFLQGKGTQARTGLSCVHTPKTLSVCETNTCSWIFISYENIVPPLDIHVDWLGYENFVPWVLEQMPKQYFFDTLV